MARRSYHRKQIRRPVERRSTEETLFDTDGAYHARNRRGLAAPAFTSLLLAPVWILSAVVNPWIPGTILALILGMSLVALAKAGESRAERRLATVSAVIAANGLVIGYGLYLIQMRSFAS